MTAIQIDGLESYWHYAQQRCPGIEASQIASAIAAAATTRWDEPETGVEFNNIAVLSLIDAEQCDDPSLRSMQLELAIAALEEGAATGHPLCTAHLIVVRRLTGDLAAASQLAFNQIINGLHSGFHDSPPLGLVYLLPTATASDVLPHLLQAPNGEIQAQRLLVDLLTRSQLAFYSEDGLRFLQLAAQLMPTSFDVQLRLGLSKINQQQWEGLLHLQQARQIAPDHAPIQQALWMLYQQQPEIAEFWRESARSHSTTGLEWCWIDESSSDYTIASFDNLRLAIEPNFDSKVTSVLLAEGDWFEAELEFWRDSLQPGMTVIDVGANVGIYTFSAAQQVKASGRVLAIEPFSGCIELLQHTCRINQLDQVTVCAGAASDRNGTAQLAIHTANELNELVESKTNWPTATIACFTLDSLIDAHQLERVDWLKIDAERHELQVLQGSDRLLQQFAPAILYENLVGTGGSNLPVAQYLRSRGYRLFRYQPFIKNLLPLGESSDFSDSLNVIALPPQD